MWKYFDPKLFKKLLILGTLSFGLAFVFFLGTEGTHATMICCDLCEPNYNGCLASCGISETCPDECAAVRDNCMISCSFC